MRSDNTENARRRLVNELNAASKWRAELEAEQGEVWDTEELMRDFEVKGFLVPFVIVRRRSTGILESLVFQDAPRFYFRFPPRQVKRN